MTSDAHLLSITSRRLVPSHSVSRSTCRTHIYRRLYTEVWATVGSQNRTDVSTGQLCVLLLTGNVRTVLFTGVTFCAIYTGLLRHIILILTYVLISATTDYCCFCQHKLSAAVQNVVSKPLKPCGYLKVTHLLYSHDLTFSCTPYFLTAHAS